VALILRVSGASLEPGRGLRRRRAPAPPPGAAAAVTDSTR